MIELATRISVRLDDDLARRFEAAAAAAGVTRSVATRLATHTTAIPPLPRRRSSR